MMMLGVMKLMMMMMMMMMMVAVVGEGVGSSVRKEGGV